MSPLDISKALQELLPVPGEPAGRGEASAGLLLAVGTTGAAEVAGAVAGVVMGELLVVAGLVTGIKEVVDPGAGAGAVEGEPGQVLEVLPAHVWTHWPLRAAVTTSVSTIEEPQTERSKPDTGVQVLLFTVWYKASGMETQFGHDQTGRRQSLSSSKPRAGLA